jgi:hypothetical protein
MLQEAIKVATANMKELYELSGGVEHDGEKGAFREFFITQLIQPLIPIHFSVGSGVVVDWWGRQSRQSDVIIYDRRKLQPILLAGTRGLFPIDSVLAVIEVKSRLKATDYVNLVEAGRRFSPYSEIENPMGLLIKRAGILPENQAIYPAFAVFAYTSDAPKKDEGKRIEERTTANSHYIKLIGVLDKGVWSLENQQWKKHTDIGIEDVSARFLVMILNRLEDTARSRGDYRLQDWLP